MKISIKTNIPDVIAKLKAMGSTAIPNAIVTALNTTAQLAAVAERHEMTDVFRNPTPWTLGAVAVKVANRSGLTATVMLKDARSVSTGTPAASYLAPQIAGGMRGLKPFEMALRSAGVLPSSMYAVPGSGAQIDAYGNMARGQIIQILSYFRAFPEQGYKANITAQGKAKLARGTKRRLGFEYFVGRPGGGRLPLGVWKRVGFSHGSAIKPILIFVDSAHYNAIYNFADVATRVVGREFNRQFAAALSNAMQTAR